MNVNKKLMSMEEKKELETNQRLAESVIANCKEVGGKYFAYVPLNLLRVDNGEDGFQRDEKIKIMAEKWSPIKCTPLLTNYRSQFGYISVIDGQHRLAAARIKGIKYLVCEIFIDMSFEEEAKLFVEYNTSTRRLSSFDIFKANLCYGEETDTAIKAICDKFEIEVKKSNKIHTLRSVTAARSIMKTGGTMALEWVFSVIKESHWEDFKESYSGDMLEGLGRLYAHHIKDMNRMQRNLIKFFRNSNPSELFGLANSEYPTLGRRTRLRLILEDIVEEEKQSKMEKRIHSIA